MCSGPDRAVGRHRQGIDVARVVPCVEGPDRLAVIGGDAAVGADPGSPVTDRYQAPFAYTGKLNNVTIDVSGELIVDKEAEMRLIMARQ